MNVDSGKIILLLLSKIDPEYTSLLENKLTNIFLKPVEVLDRNSDLRYAFVKNRQQYSSPRILARLRKIRKNKGDKIMAVVDVDLFSEGYEFVYGEADINAGIATLSINRLVQQDNLQKPIRILTEERIVREAVHEMGHLYGLGHCSNLKCVMRTCTCLEEVDEAQGGLCPDCKNRLNIENKRN